MIQGFDRDIQPAPAADPLGVVGALVLAALIPAVADAVLTVFDLGEHLEYYADAIAAGTFASALCGSVIGLSALAAIRLARGPLTRRQLSAASFGTAAAVVALLSVPRVIGFDRPLIQVGFFVLPVAIFVAGFILRMLTARRDEVRVVIPAIVASVAMSLWVVLADPGLAAPRTSRLLSLLWLPALFAILFVLMTLFERRVAPKVRPSRLRTAGVWILLALVGVGWFAAREPLFADVRAKSEVKLPDILLIVLDTARADLFAIGDPAIELPVLKRFAAEAQVYSSAFANSCWTLPTHGAMFTGLPPSLNGSLTGPLNASVSTLAQRLRRAGYETAAFSGNPVIGPSSQLDRGFDRFENFLPGEKLRERAHVWLNAVVTSRSSATRPLWHLRDDGGAIMVSRALRYLDSSTAPSFVFLNLFEPHDPYAPPYLPDEWSARNGFAPRELRLAKGEPYAELGPWPPPGGEERYFQAMRILYKGELAYVDRLLGELLSRLEKSGRMDDTVIVIVSDHGENIGEHFPSLTHTLGLYDTLTHVPMMIRYPPAVRAGVDDRLISTDALHDMLLDLAGVEGTRVMPKGAASNVVFSEYVPDPGLIGMIEAMAGRKLPEYDRTLRAVRTREKKWIEASDGRHEAYDLIADPLEQRNLVSAPATIPPGFESLAAMLAERPLLSREGNRVPEELEKSLRALGYNQ